MGDFKSNYNGNDGGGLGTIMEAIADTPALINVNFP